MKEPVTDSHVLMGIIIAFLAFIITGPSFMCWLAKQNPAYQRMEEAAIQYKQKSEQLERDFAQYRDGVKDSN